MPTARSRRITPFTSAVARTAPSVTGQSTASFARIIVAPSAVTPMPRSAPSTASGRRRAPPIRPRTGAKCPGARGALQAPRQGCDLVSALQGCRHGEDRDNDPAESEAECADPPEGAREAGIDGLHSREHRAWGDDAEVVDLAWDQLACLALTTTRSTAPCVSCHAVGLRQRHIDDIQRRPVEHAPGGCAKWDIHDVVEADATRSGAIRGEYADNVEIEPAEPNALSDGGPQTASDTRPENSDASVCILEVRPGCDRVRSRCSDRQLAVTPHSDVVVFCPLASATIFDASCAMPTSRTPLT